MELLEEVVPLGVAVGRGREDLLELVDGEEDRRGRLAVRRDLGGEGPLQPRGERRQQGDVDLQLPRGADRKQRLQESRVADISGSLAAIGYRHRLDCKASFHGGLK